MNKLRSNLGVTVLAGALAACGGGSGGSVDDDTSNLPNSRPTADISGIAFDGLIIGGDVVVYDFTGGVKGDRLGGTMTDGRGLYSLSISTSSKPVLIEISGGYYLEEASGKKVSVDRSQGDRMMAVEYYESGSDLNISATLFTTIATGYAEYLIKEDGVAATAAIEMAYAQVDSWAGFDVRKTVPVDVSDGANVTPYMTNQHRYGFISAGVSELTRVVGLNVNNGVHDDYTSIKLADAIYDDVRFDKELDGVGESGTITFGNLILNSFTYRELLPLRMLQFVGGDRNKTGMEFDDVLPFASHMNTFSEAIFDYTTAPNIAEAKPSVSQFLPAEGELVSGSYQASVIADDDYGLQSVEFYVDDQYVGEANPDSPRRLIDTLNFSNGEHSIKVVVTNVMGNAVSETHNIFVNNGSLTFTIPSGEIEASGVESEWTGTCSLQFTVHDSTTAGVEFVKLDQSFVLLDDDVLGGVKTINFSQEAGPRDSCTKHTIEAQDRVGGHYVQNISVSTRRQLFTSSTKRAWCTMHIGSNC